MGTFGTQYNWPFSVDGVRASCLGGPLWEKHNHAAMFGRTHIVPERIYNPQWGAVNVYILVLSS